MNSTPDRIAQLARECAAEFHGAVQKAAQQNRVASEMHYPPVSYPHLDKYTEKAGRAIAALLVEESGCLTAIQEAITEARSLDSNTDPLVDRILAPCLQRLRQIGK